VARLAVSESKAIDAKACTLPAEIINVQSVVFLASFNNL
jgi:hypothetical protein